MTVEARKKIMYYAIQMALRVPDGRCKKLQYASLSPVNLFRLVFACLEDKAPDFLPDKYYMRGSEELQEISLPPAANSGQ